MDKLAVVIHTCDKYDFCWEGWHYYFDKHWDYSLPWKIYFLNESKDFPIKNNHIHQIKSGEGEWSDRLIKGINLLEENYIFYFQEDVFITKPINLRLFKKLFQLVIDNQINALRILTNNNQRFYKTNKSSLLKKNLYKFDTFSSYLVSHQPSIIHRDFLLKTLLPNESPWENEINGTKRLKNENKLTLKKILNFNRHINHKIYLYLLKDWYIATVRSGKFTSEGKKLLEKMNIELSLH